MIAREDAPTPPRAIRFTAPARDELRDAVAWYEEHAPAVIPAFLLGIEAALAQAARHPESFSVVQPDLRRALVRRFPYGVFYTHDADTLVVLAIVHARRDPALWPLGAAG